MDKLWDGFRVSYAMNVLAAVTGMRRGELLGLLNRNVHPDHIYVEKSFGHITGVKNQTNGLDPRYAPMTPEVYQLLQTIMRGGPEGFIFSLHEGSRHYSENKILPKLKAALLKMEMTEQERTERNLVFHRWRHTKRLDKLTGTASHSPPRRSEFSICKGQ